MQVISMPVSVWRIVWLACAILILGQVDFAFAAKSPFGVALPETTAPIASSGFWGEIQQWILTRQAVFYMALKDAVKLVESNWLALGSLLGLSFAYGAFHAAGPGHGKVVLTTYLFASGATARKGAFLALVAAFVQASVAVMLIGVAAVALNLTSFVITQTAQMLELASYVMFVVLGAWLLLRAWKRFRAVRNHSQHVHHHEHDHHHSHDCECGHSHAPDPELVEQAQGIRGMALAVISMGLRPCSGALIILVFALSQNVFWAGVLAAYAMGLGTGLTIAMLALVATYARHFSQSLAETGLSDGLLSWFGVGLLAVAGGIVLAFGAVLLLANLL